MIEECRELFEQLVDKVGIGDALDTGGLIALGQGLHEEGSPSCSSRWISK